MIKVVMKFQISQERKPGLLIIDNWYFSAQNAQIWGFGLKFCETNIKFERKIHAKFP